MSLTLWFVAAAPAIGDPLPRTILVIDEFTQIHPWFQREIKAFTSTLGSESKQHINVYVENLGVQFYDNENYYDALRSYYAKKYRGRPIGVIVSRTGPTLTYPLRLRDELWPDTPVVLAGIEDKDAPALDPSRQNLTGFTFHYRLRDMAEAAHALIPDLKEFVLVGDRLSTAQVLPHYGDDLPEIGSQFGIIDLTGLSRAELQKRLPRLPADSVVLYTDLSVDPSTGDKIIPADALQFVAEAANRPTFVNVETYIGRGAIGGPVLSPEVDGKQAARLAMRVLDGEKASDIPIQDGGVEKLVFDWRQMQRWGIDTARLPKDAELRFYEPTAWERYRPQILGALAVMVLQTATIVALVIQDRRRRRIEQELALERLELAHLSRRTQLGELSGAFAHELNQPLTSILANAEAGARLLGKDPPETQELKEILGDIVEEDKRAAGVIAQLRRLMVKGEAELDSVDLNEAVTATIALARSELLARQTKCDFQRGQPFLPVRGNLVQLQQVILNLILNAIDAMSQLTPSERHIAITTRRRDDGFRELAISDRGHGLAPEMREKAFKPFVSTKANGLGLGLAICRSIALAHGGTLKFDEQRTNGAQVILALPPT